MTHGLKASSPLRSPGNGKTLNKDLSGLDDAEIFSRKSELEHMEEIRANARAPFQTKFSTLQFDDDDPSDQQKQ